MSSAERFEAYVPAFYLPLRVGQGFHCAAWQEGEADGGVVARRS